MRIFKTKTISENLRQCKPPAAHKPATPRMPALGSCVKTAVYWLLTNYFWEMHQSVECRDRFRSRATDLAALSNSLGN